MAKTNTILVAYDFSDASREALKKAQELADKAKSFEMRLKEAEERSRVQLLLEQDDVDQNSTDGYGQPALIRGPVSIAR